ncbi:hypothetical protein GQX74_009846 [Glossina fuscipes]|nr:hypothetical protein GQX74_009846 [Glossina fuscipes]
MKTTSVGRYALRLSFGQLKIRTFEEGNLISGNMESSGLQAGDLCIDCQQLGLEKRLRYFTINLQEEQILKCENVFCLYPHNDELSSSTDDDNDDDNKTDYEYFTKTQTEPQTATSPNGTLSGEEFTNFLITSHQQTNLDYSLDFLEFLEEEDLKVTATSSVQQNDLCVNLPSVNKPENGLQQNALNLNVPSISEQDTATAVWRGTIKEEMKEKPKIEIQSVETIKAGSICNLDKSFRKIPKANIRSGQTKLKNKKVQKTKINALDQVMSLLKLKKNS